MSTDYYIVRYKNQEKLIHPSELTKTHLGVKLTNKEIVKLKENVFNDIYKNNYEVKPLILRNDKKYGKFAKLYDLGLDYHRSEINLNPKKNDYSIQIDVKRNNFGFYLSNKSGSLHISIHHDGEIETLVAVNKSLQKLARSKSFINKTLRFARDRGLSTDYFDAPFIATKKNVKELETWLKSNIFNPK